MTTAAAFKSQGLVRAEFKSKNQLAKALHPSVMLDAEDQGELGEVHHVGYVLWSTPEAFRFMGENVVDLLAELYDADDLNPHSSVAGSWRSAARILFRAAGAEVPECVTYL